MANASPAYEAACLNGGDGTGTLNLTGFVACHTGAGPGTTGALEYAGVTRQPCTWNPASTTAGTKTNSSSETWTTSGATAVTWLGAWSAATAGTYAIGLQLSSAVTAATITAAPGSLSLSAA